MMCTTVPQHTLSTTACNKNQYWILLVGGGGGGEWDRQQLFMLSLGVHIVYLMYTIIKGI